MTSESEEAAIQARQNERTTLSSMIADREGRITNAERMLELLQPEWDKFEAREAHNLYVSRDYAEHTSAVRRHRAELLALATLRARLEVAEAENVRLRDALEDISLQASNHGGWFDQPGQQFIEYAKLGQIANEALAQQENET